MAIASAIVLAVVATTDDARAYRPFDSTDAGVVEPGEIELEIGPIGYVREDGEDMLVTPDVVMNVGLRRRWELVLEAKATVLLRRGADGASAEIRDTGALLKHLLREGSLQDGRGPSVATEFGVLLPDSHRSERIGGTALAVVSDRIAHGTVHVNFAATRTRDGDHAVFSGVIVEGP